MNTPKSSSPGRRLWLAVLAGTLVLTACGGGGGSSAGVGSGGTGSFAVGPISGFGSVIVNGIRYDDAGATVLDADDQPRASDDLRLGMVIEVTGSALTRPGDPLLPTTATAQTIRYGSEVLGPVEAVDAVAGTLTVFGQNVDVNASTVFDSALAGGLAALMPGQVVEVYGLASGGRIVATRIESQTAATRYRLRGAVSDLDTAARTLRIGATAISYAAIANPPPLANGDLVRVRLFTTASAGVWSAERLRSGARPLADRDDVEIEGLVTAFVSAANFSVDGIPVDASAATFDDGGPADLQLGVRVEVEGRLRSGVLIAREVEFEDDDDGDASGTGSIELAGSIQDLDTVTRRFTLRGLTVDYATAGFDDGDAADLANGVAVEVDGRLGADGVTVVAIEIEFDG
jgi:hypothetical protein